VGGWLAAHPVRAAPNGQVLGLSWSAVDLDADTVAVRAGRVVVGQGRTVTVFVQVRGLLVGAPVGIRTPNLLIRSQMLYPLSYGRPSRTHAGLGEDSGRPRPIQNRGVGSGGHRAGRCPGASRERAQAL
jgi:hypothetical protein